jgi:hypothetical protein
LADHRASIGNIQLSSYPGRSLPQAGGFFGNASPDWNQVNAIDGSATRGGCPAEAALFLFRVKGSLFGIKPRNQFLDPIDSQFVVDRGGEPSIVLDPVVEFSALVTHRGSTFVFL